MNATEWVRGWAHSVRSPSSACEALLNPAHSPDERLRGAAKLWVVAAVIATLAQVPVLRSAGIAGGELGYFLPHGLQIISALLAAGAALHLALRVGKVPSSLVDTLVISTVYASVFAPVMALLAVPSTIPIFKAVVAAKAAGLPFQDAYRSAFLQSAQPANVHVGAQLITGVVFCLLPLWYGLMVGYLTRYYAVPKLTIVRSLGFSFAMLTPLTLLLTMGEYFVLFQFM